MLAQIFYAGFEIGEVTCPTKYFEEASSINFSRSVKYGLGVIATSLKYRLQKMGLIKSKLFSQFQLFSTLSKHLLVQIFPNENEIENTTSNNDHLSEEIKKINELLKSGVLTQEEFEKAKKKILDN